MAGVHTGWAQLEPSPVGSQEVRSSSKILMMSWRTARSGPSPALMLPAGPCRSLQSVNEELLLGDINLHEIAAQVSEKDPQ